MRFSDIVRSARKAAGLTQADLAELTGIARPNIAAYEIVLREGTPRDIAAIVDEVLLCEAWPDLVLPGELRRAWDPLIEASTATAHTLSHA